MFTALLNVEDIAVGPLPAVNPGGVVFKIVIVPLIDIFHGSEKTRPLDSPRNEIFVDDFNGKRLILDSAVHVGIDDHYIHHEYVLPEEIV
jgi:hypothetical protein